MSLFRPTIYATVMAFLTGCGFQPLYGSAGNINIAAELASVEIAVIEHRMGQQLRNHLLDHINPSGPPRSPNYTLVVRLRETKQELAVKKTAFSTRINYVLTAKYLLKGRQQNAGVELAETSKIVTGYNILGSDFATLIAEQDARTRAVRELSTAITNRVAIFIQKSPRSHM